MDVLREMKEVQEINARVAKLQQQKASPKLIRRAMQVMAKPEESPLAYKARLLVYSYAGAFMEAAKGKEINLTFQPEDAELAARTVGCVYEVNRDQRQMKDEDNLVLISKELGSYLALTLCNAMGGKMKVKSVPVHPVRGLSSLLMNGMIMTVTLPGYREVNPIEVATKVMRSVKVSETGMMLNQEPIQRLLVDKKA